MLKTSWGGGKTLTYILGGVFALAISSAWAEDWKVSENTWLTEDKTVDALTVNEGVTLDLNGYKLTCTSLDCMSLDGNGTITSPDGDTDLTSADTTEPYHVTWFIKADTGNDVMNGPLRTENDTTPRNLFDDEDSTRVLMSKGSNNANMPLAVIYDFGYGKQKTVNKYSIRGPGSNFARGPKAWTFEGSDNGTTWNELHSKDDESWTSATTKEYQFSNSTAYRYYRIKFTESADTNTSYGGPYLELNELRFYNTNPGELHVNVAEGGETTVGSLTISGNVKVVKDGAGRLNGITNIGSGKFPGELEVKDGTVYVAVKNDRFNIGTGGNGTLTINGGTVEVDSSSTTAVGFSEGKTGTVNLNGGILKTTRLVNVYGTGIVNFNGGTLQANAVDDNGLIKQTVTVTVNECGGTIDSGNLSITVPAAIRGTGAMRFKGGGTITLEGAISYIGGTTIELGTKVVTSVEAAKDTILGNLVIDGKSQLTDAEGIEVFQYGSALAEGELKYVSLENCDENSTKYIVDNCIKVDFVVPTWVLNANANWSALYEDEEICDKPAPGATLRIKADGVYTLTIDQDVDVGQLVFTNNNPNVVVNSGCTVKANAINFSAANDYYVLNNGQIDLNGSGETSLKFHNDSRGTYKVNNGTLKVSGVTTGGDTPGLVPEGTNQFVCVASGATYDLNGVADNTASVRLAAGATVANSGATIAPGKKQIPQLILDGDATANISSSFGLIATGHTETRLDLGEHTLTITGGVSTYNFYLDNTTITGTGTILVKGGRLFTTMANSTGADCTLIIGENGTMDLGQGLTVTNFTNGGTATGNNSQGQSWLTVTGTLTPGNPLKRLTLADGATVKASATASQTVNNGFSAPGKVTIDASDITKVQLNAAAGQRIAVLTVPTADKSGDWTVANSRVVGCRYKWVDNGNNTSTLYIVKPTGFIIIIR